MTRRSFHPRSLVAFVMAAGFLVAAITGLVLFVTPRGGLASWTGWTLGGLDRDVWFDVHLVTGLLFILTGLLHLYFNWKPLRAYLYSRASRSLNRGRELAVAAMIVGFVVVGAAQDWLPVGYLLDLNDWARTEMWATPVAPAGLAAEPAGFGRGRKDGMGLGRMTLSELAARHGLDYHELSGRLAAAGIVFAEDEPLRDIAARAGTTPSDLAGLARGTDH